mgnify:CR=1 FL=1
MKKFFALIGILIFTSLYVFADEYSLFTGNACTYNDIWKNLSETQFLIKYDDSEKTYYLFTADWMNKIWVYLSDDDLQTIREAIIKYQDWVKIAKEKQVEINKEIPNATIRTKVVWNFGDDWYSSSGFTLSFSVLSQNTQRHEFLISSNKVTSSSNQFVNVKLDTLYIEEKDAADFLAGINESQISKRKEEHNRKREAQDLFN